MSPRRLTLKVVENEDDKLKAFVVRGIVYIHEQKCPYAEEFDLNDYSATQILGLVDDEPAVTARIRYFGGLAKLERLAIREEYRGYGYGHELLRFLLWLCQSKGINEFYLHAQARLERFYNQYGFSRVGEDFAFSNHEYIAMYAKLPPVVVVAASPAQDPLLMNRPEGRWSVPGPIEKSLERVEPEPASASEPAPALAKVPA